MRTMIVGDSFVQYCTDTWIETIAKRLGLDIAVQMGNPGGCEFFTYENFVDNLKTDHFDLVLFTHTEHHRLPNPLKLGITPIMSTKNIGKGLPDRIVDASRAYYENLYYDRFHKDTHDLLIKEMQSICWQQQIKQIHLQSFNNVVPMTHGLWIANGMHSLATLCGEQYYLDHSLRNHFDRELHQKFAVWFGDCLENYFSAGSDLQIVRLNRDDFR